VYADSVDGFQLNEALPWVPHASVYEILPASYSPSGDLDGITSRHAPASPTSA